MKLMASQTVILFFFLSEFKLNFIFQTADLIFKIIELPNPNYKRKGDDLIYYAKISLVEALSAGPINIV